MAPVLPPPGIRSDLPRVDPSPFWAHAINVRFRLGQPETVGFIKRVLDVAGAQLQLPGADRYRSILTTPSSLSAAFGGQVLFGSASKVVAMTFDAASTPVTGTRWQLDEITPAGFSTLPDTLPSPPTGGIDIPPNVAFVPQDDVVVIVKANDNANGPWSWDRDPGNVAVAISTAPPGAVGAAVVNRHLVLLGAQSVGETGQTTPPLAPVPGHAERFLTVRWSDFADFANWNQSVDTLAGETQLDSGSRIVGGGRVRQGVACWTDENLWIITYDPTSEAVFIPTVVDGSGGLMSNQAWCETDGRIWYFDTNRRLMVYDGGSPRPVPNPIKASTIERISQTQLARAYLWANPEFDEVVLCYPTSGASDPDAQLVYNYALDAWYPWGFSRTAWHRRKSMIDAVAVDATGLLFWHDTDSGLEQPYLLPPSYAPGLGVVSVLPSGNSAPAAADVVPFDFALFTNPIPTGEVTSTTYGQTRLQWDMIGVAAVGAADTLDIHSAAYGQSQIPGAQVFTDVVTIAAGDTAVDIRLGGKMVQLGITGDQIKTQVRIGAFNRTVKAGGKR